MKTDGIVLILLLCAAGMVCANETKVVADGKLRFEVPEHEMLDFGWEEDDPAKVRVSVECLGNEDIKNREPESLSPLLYQQLVQNGYKINSANIRQLIAENDIAKSGTFSMEANYFIRSKGKIYKNYLSVSYKKLIYDGVAIGEKFLHLPSTEYDADDPFNITYHVNLVLDDRLVFISIWLLRGDAKGVASAFPELFETRSDGKQYWVNAEAQDKFHEIFDGEEYKKLPDTIRLVRETRDAILSTLQINEGGFGEAAETNLEELAATIQNNLFPREFRTPELVCTLSAQTMEDLVSLYHDHPHELSSSVREIFERQESMSAEELSALLNSDRDYILDRHFPMTTVEASYRKFRAGPTRVGEIAFSTAMDGLSATETFSYCLFLLDGGKIHGLRLQAKVAGSYRELDDVWPALPDLTYKKNGYWYWRNQEAVYELCRLMESRDGRVPQALLALQEAWEYVLSNLEVDGKKVVVEERRPGPPMKKYMAAADNLRLRSDDDSKASVVTTMAKGSRVKVLSAGGRAATIDGIGSNWVRVEILSGARDKDGKPIPAEPRGKVFLPSCSKPLSPPLNPPDTATRFPTCTRKALSRT